MQRKHAILRAASALFGLHGYRGTNLREIARDAGVSLTLLNHHFGCKSDVLASVIDAHRAVLDDYIAALRRVTSAGRGHWTPLDLVQAWVRIGFECAAGTDGELFLRVVARLLDDPSEPAGEVVRERLDEAAQAFIEALQTCYPHAPRYAIASAHLWVSASLLRFLTGGDRLLRLARADATSRDLANDPDRLTRFLVAGIDAALAAVPRRLTIDAGNRALASGAATLATAAS
jgi:AcrR family transcriptional regulator